MDIVLITGSAGLIGSEAVRFFAKKEFPIVGLDNDRRGYFFGPEASTQGVKENLENTFNNYDHKNLDIRDYDEMQKIFQERNRDIKLIIHAAAQPSHDWAAQEMLTDFTINANGTLNLLELTRQYAPEAVFIFVSTNKVYGDLPNSLPFRELPTRWELPQDHRYYQGIDERMTIDQSTHSLFGVSKSAADLLVQEYGRYFGMKTVCFRAGCVTGPNQAGVMLHGFLSYLMRCCLTDKPYTIFGYKGKQLRDHIHSFDVVNAFYHFYQNPKSGAVYNLGGGRQNSCSVLEAIHRCTEMTGKKLNYTTHDAPRKGDHQWYVTNNQKFQSDYPAWRQTFSLSDILKDLNESFSHLRSENPSSHNLIP